jgi:C-3',4' desaturase CrtD
MRDERIVVVGAGIGGLTAAALLAKSGLDVTVVEAHIYPGGCAGTFFHRGYRFDAGATLAAGFQPDGGMDRLGQALGILWPIEQAELALGVLLPDGTRVTRWPDPVRWREERIAHFGQRAEPFWQWQEETATRMWALALKGAPWPPQGRREMMALGSAGWRTLAGAPGAMPGLALDAFRPVSVHLRGMPEQLRRYVDGQLLISAQATSDAANALYGAAALDMPRRGVVHVRGGMGAIAERLAEALRRQGGRLHLRRRVTAVGRDRAGAYLVTTERGPGIPADQVIFNLPPWDAAALLGDDAPQALSRSKPPADGWGAFIAYVGVDGAGLPGDAPLHQQILAGEPLGEGNSLFLSLSLPDDAERAPTGHRALTISTHTQLEPWWALFARDRSAYEARKEEYTRRLLVNAERALPGLRDAAQLVLPGTPVSFQRFTHRSLGWVGGYPQTRLGRAQAPRLGKGLWLVGDSIFPGQSVLATALGGMRVAGAIMTPTAQRIHEPNAPGVRLRVQ